MSKSHRRQQRRSSPVSRRALFSIAGASAGVAAGAAGLAAWRLRDRTESGGTSSAPETSAAPESTAEPTLDVAAREAWVDSAMSGMSLETKVGQLFMVYAYGDSSSGSAHAGSNQGLHGVDNPAQLFADYRVGGIIYFDWTDNLLDPAQIAELSAGIHQASLEHTGVQALIGVDQEHGPITRIGEPVTTLPGAMALGASGEASVAEESARICGTELRAMGINLDFAPVADVNVNPANPVIGLRSFSSDPDLAAEMVAAQVRGFQPLDDGIAACAKHFPGHGDTDVDSHVGLPVITHSEDEWRSIDLPPFQSAIGAEVDLIMSAHLQFPALDDSGTPATLSQPILTGLLRDELGFEGAITTDALNMEGVRVQHSDAEIPVLALQAGVDLLLMPQDLPTAYQAVLDAVADGTLTEDRIDASVRRLLRIRYHRGFAGDPPNPEEVSAVGTDEHAAAAASLFERTVVVERGGELLPIGPGAAVAVEGPDGSAVDTLVQALTDEGLNPTAWGSAGDSDFAVVLCEDAGEWSDQMGRVRSAAESGTPTAAVSTGKPYDVAYFPDGVAAMATCSSAAPAMRALAGVLAGRVEAASGLPVEI
ncbi:glycoside hydrolase family 3 protein [Glycomyces xiaoerkulensis]|uniref:glycoside hydrolase family 3 protein n=1 Tax=Glycomyces xiaoerkulensis TaxID=2038139 RepID=UPI000C2571D9|nr:glycoside hydrolase family 3 protein [Glycomyces xiaoerkulensis]